MYISVKERLETLSLRGRGKKREKKEAKKRDKNNPQRGKYK